ncbi:MAG: HAD family hydrolase [Deltaproteobacteria bacterium]
MKAVFLDRDGTINHEEPNYLTDIRRLKIFKEAFEAIKLLNRHQFKTIVVTNQSCVARGLLKEEELIKINEKLKARLARKKAFLDSIYYCPHHPTDECLCRKPNTGLLERAVREHQIALQKSFFIGDRMFDIRAGKKGGCKTILVLTGAGRETLENLKTEVPLHEHPDCISENVLDAVQWIIRNIS